MLSPQWGSGRAFCPAGSTCFAAFCRDVLAQLGISIRACSGLPGLPPRPPRGRPGSAPQPLVPLPVAPRRGGRSATGARLADLADQAPSRAPRRPLGQIVSLCPFVPCVGPSGTSQAGTSPGNRDGGGRGPFGQSRGRLANWSAPCRKGHKDKRLGPRTTWPRPVGQVVRGPTVRRAESRARFPRGLPPGQMVPNQPARSLGRTRFGFRECRGGAGRRRTAGDIGAAFAIRSTGSR
jgi:hypothetical protein